MLPVTSFVTALAAVALVALSLLVSFRRRSAKISLGEGDDRILARRIRAHGNFIEYVPLALIALGLAEARQAPAVLLWLIAGLLIFGRASHAAGLLGGIIPARAAGALATLASLLLAAGVLLFA